MALPESSGVLKIVFIACANRLMNIPQMGILFARTSLTAVAYLVVAFV
jgi:hypothetical protein